MEGGRVGRDTCAIQLVLLSVPTAGGCSQEGGLGHQARLRGEHVDGSRSVSVLLDEAAVVLSAWGRVNGCPAVLAVVAETVDVATEVGSILATAVDSMTLITDLVIQHIRLDFHLQEGGGEGRERGREGGEQRE